MGLTVRHPMLLWISALAGALWVATLVVMLSADWYLECTVHGQQLGGIDCFQANVPPKTASTPASWFGFIPLAVTWLAANATLLVCGTLALIRRESRQHPPPAHN
jgi:hypothetical protein